MDKSPIFTIVLATFNYSLASKSLQLSISAVIKLNSTSCKKVLFYDQCCEQGLNFVCQIARILTFYCEVVNTDRPIRIALPHLH